jgi:hypothetical protein
VTAAPGHHHPWVAYFDLQVGPKTKMIPPTGIFQDQTFREFQLAEAAASSDRKRD